MSNQTKTIILFLIFLFLMVSSSTSISAVQAQEADKPMVFQNLNYVEIENITLRGDGTGVGLTLQSCAHTSLYNVHIENFAVGIKIEDSIAINIYNPQLISNTEIGLLLSGHYGINRVFGGSIVANGIGVKIDNSSMMNQFYGVEIECNKQNELTFGNYTYGNLFEGNYFERTADTSNDFFNMTQTIGINTFYANKFASQGKSTLSVYGDSNIFKDNIFDSGTVVLSIYGDKNVFQDNRQGPEIATITLNDAGAGTQYQNNFFKADNLPQLPQSSQPPGEESPDPTIPEFPFFAILLLFAAMPLIITVLLRKNTLPKLITR